MVQHYPLYRDSDSVCSEPDEAPAEIKNTRFREKWECISKDATEMASILTASQKVLLMLGYLETQPDITVESAYYIRYLGSALMT